MKQLKYIMPIIAFLVSQHTIFAQYCCTKTSRFELLATDPHFKEAHLSPEHFEFTPAANGRMIKFNTTDADKQGHAYYLPSDKPTNNVLILFHEWWGLNDYMKQEAEKWQTKLGNIDVYAIDLYDGGVAVNPDEAARLSKNLEKARGETIINGLLSRIGPNKVIATIGWCMGGSWSFTGALLADNKIAA